VHVLLEPPNLSGAERMPPISNFTDADTDAPLVSRSGEKRPTRGTPPDSLPRNERFGMASSKTPVAMLNSNLRSLMDVSVTDGHHRLTKRYSGAFVVKLVERIRKVL